MIIDTDANTTDELVADFAKTLDGALSGGTEAKAALRRMYIAAVEHASDLRAINALLVSEVRAATHDHCPYCGEAMNGGACPDCHWPARYKTSGMIA